MCVSLRINVNISCFDLNLPTSSLIEKVVSSNTKHPASFLETLDRDLRERSAELQNPL